MHVRKTLVVAAGLSLTLAALHVWRTGTPAPWCATRGAAAPRTPAARPLAAAPPADPAAPAEAAPPAPPARTRAEQLGLPADTLVQLKAWRYVQQFERQLAQFETVFWEPDDTDSLRQWIRETPLVRGKRVLEIGTGTGLVALCCLQAGAASVVATDINPSAVANAAYNAELLQLHDRLETRLVPRDRPGAFSVISAEERFDLIISNPPWEDRQPRDQAEYALYDQNFDLLRSLLTGLDKHLAPDGRLLLAYGSRDAIRVSQRLCRERRLQCRVLDDRDPETLPDGVFLPGMLLQITR